MTPLALLCNQLNWRNKWLAIPVLPANTSLSSLVYDCKVCKSSQNQTFSGKSLHENNNSLYS